jgi:hypothetical protein
MPHIKIHSIHTSPDEPVFLYSELDESRREIRKVEIFWDGKMGYATRDANFGPTRLEAEPIPSLSEVEDNPELVASEITSEDFEEVWRRALRAAQG